MPREQLSLFSYVVRVTFTTREAMQEFLAWLRGGHITDVVKAGALSGYVVELDDALALEAHYRFASREAFDKYLRDEAPRLREEGLQVAARVGGVTFARSSGEIVHEHP